MNSEPISQGMLNSTPLNAPHHQLGVGGPLQIPVDDQAMYQNICMYGPNVCGVDAGAYMHEQNHLVAQEPSMVSSTTAATAAVASASDYRPNLEATVPSYDEIFPALPDGEAKQLGIKEEGMNSPWSQKMKVRSTNVTQVICVPPEERRRDLQNHFASEIPRICFDIMQKTGTQIETSNSKDGTITFVVTGKEENVTQAKKMISSEFKTQNSASLAIPKKHHKFILGKSGKRLQELEQSSGTKIQVPHQNDPSEEIKIIGSRDALDRAIHEIQLWANEVASRSMERISIPKIYHPFISGPFSENVQQLMAETGAKVNIPPTNVQSDEISITGDDKAVMAAKAKILELYDEKQKKCQTVCIEVKKSQHRYIRGKSGQTLQEIFKETGVSIEIPPSESTSETITLRGEQDKLGPALTVLYQKAHSELESLLDVEDWVQRRIRGNKGSRFLELHQPYPNVRVFFIGEENKIRLKGPTAEVQKFTEIIENEVKRIKSEIVVKELKADPKFHRHIIGKNGVNIKHIRDETGVQIHVPSETEQIACDIIRIEGPPENVERAEEKLNAIIKEREKEVSQELIIDHRFHKQIIGAKGEKIREIRDKFNQVTVAFPDSNSKSDKVTIRGAKDDVDRCYKHLAQLNKELLAKNYSVEVPIYKQFHKFIIGKDGATIRKIRDETDTKIELPSEVDTSDVIVITGKKENVEQAKQKIIAKQNELVNETQVDIIIPQKFHNSIIGAQGRIIRSIREDCGGVVIRFPNENVKSDKVTIRGPKDCVMKAKQQLVELTHEKEINNHHVNVQIPRKYHRFLIGKNGANLKKIRDSTGAKIIIPTEKEIEENPADADFVFIIGKKEAAMKAKEELEAMRVELDKTITETVIVPRQFQRFFMVRQFARLKQIEQDVGNVRIQFPDQNNPSEEVTLKGSKESVEQAKAQLSEIVNDMDIAECVIDHQHHKTIMRYRGNKVQSLQQEYDVQIKFPEPKVNGFGGDELVNGVDHSYDENGTEGSESRSPQARKEDVITITGRKKDCEAVKEALLAAIPVTIEVPVPFDYHRFIIGQKGKDVRELMNEFDVQISVPPAQEHSDTIKIHGPQANVDRAKACIIDRVQKLDDEKQDRIARGFKVEIHVDPKYHPKIIGRKGAIISNIREKYDVQVQFPERSGDAGQPNQDLITIIGYEEKAKEARNQILEIVQELEDRVSEELEIDYRIHPRLIGKSGRNIKKVMDKFKVDIRFPKSTDANQNLVTITGPPENIEGAKEHLLELQDRYLDDVNDEVPQRYLNDSTESRNTSEQRGFFVKGGPWEQQQQQIVPDTNNTDEFPSMSSESVTTAPRARWGPTSGSRVGANYSKNS